ncbi:DNA gyrase subunit A [Rubeoparvulum massiliense]|uniref:DNA gyrase subunit A n=1 Tax=Rubeoparvulum massiliense TaxID=1631346 RepID=UPI00069F61CC|nr:DNA gyrase subunit A [Rubeoparvulum massiliense]
MAEFQVPRVQEINLNDEVKNSFIDYAMSVIVSRALPDVRDGLKPVHRRILYSMNQLGMTPDKGYSKSARVVGDVLAKYHPHGDASVYDAMVRMAQDFSFRYMLVDGHGNFGSVDGDAPAAMRYTEARMAKITLEMLRDINKETIDFQDNYDGKEQEPVVLPARFPNLLVNGAAGIAVGMATNIPPHNLREVTDGILALIKNPDMSIDELMYFIKGPDFPTGAMILGKDGIKKAYRTGRGTVLIRARTEIEEMSNGKSRIIVSELPYQVNKAKLVERIAELVRDKKIDGITDLRDESDRDGMRMVIELRRDVIPQVVLNNLYKHTALQASFGINMLALVNGTPQTLNIKQILEEYVKHQQDVIRRRTQFDLNKAEARAHIVQGLLIALDHIDRVIELIRASQTAEEARDALMGEFELSHEQAQAILDMRLQRLTGLERGKLQDEYEDLQIKIAELRAILADENRILGIISEELTEIKNKYGDPRRTSITIGEHEIADEDLIPEEDVVITLTHQGYIKRLPVNTYRSQKRGGKGVQGMSTKEDDFVEHLYITNSHDYLMFFTNLGKAYRLKAYEVPEMGRTAKGLPIVNLIQIEKGERITAMIPVKEFSSDHFLLFATKEGIVKRTSLDKYINCRKNGLIAISFREGDELIGVRLTDGSQSIILGTEQGMSIHFNETDVREMGRSATGVKGITLDNDDYVIDVGILRENTTVLTVSKNGYGKRTYSDEYRQQTRGGKGIKTMNVTDKTGPLVGMKVVSEQDDLMVVTATGVIIRVSTEEISTMGRYTQGVRVMKVEDEQEVATVALVQKDDEEEV